MHKLRNSVAVLGFLAVSMSAIAWSAETDIWQPMSFHDLRTPSATDPLQTLIWPDEISQANAYVTQQLKRPLNGKNALLTVLSATYHLNEKTLIISTALVRGCDSGANDQAADIEPSTCPLRIAILRGGKLVSMRQETGCYADHADPGLPSKNRADNSFTLFDPKAGTILMRTSVGGKQVPNCDRKFQIDLP